MKKVNGMVAAVAFAAVAGVNVYNAQVTETVMSDLQMENLEALADGTPEATVGKLCLYVKGHYCSYPPTPSDPVRVLVPGVFLY